MNSIINNHFYKCYKTLLKIILRNLPGWNRTNNPTVSINNYSRLLYQIDATRSPYYTVKLSLSPFTLDIEISYPQIQSENYKINELLKSNYK